MANSIFTRRHVSFGLAAAGGMMLAPRRASAADFTLRHQHGLPVDSPLHKRALQMWAAIRTETGGRVDVQITQDGNASMDMLTKGELAFMTLAGNGLASLMPVADVQATPYGFRNPAQVYRALDGALGDYLRGELRSKDLYAIPGGCFENGMHQITSATRPIHTAADIQGLKMRVPGSPAYQDFFKSLGAQIVTTNLTRTYDALKSGVVEAQDDPWDVVELFKFYEMQQYSSITDPSSSGYNMLASMKVWQSLPADVQSVIETNTRKFVALQRADNDALNVDLRRDLERKGR